MVENAFSCKINSIAYGIQVSYGPTIPKYTGYDENPRMCQALPQRRHRAAYVAPSADLYPDWASLGAADDDTAASLIPLLVEVPSDTRYQPISPTSSMEWLDLEGLEAKTANTKVIQWKVQLIHSLKACYRWCVDILVVVFMCTLGCFFYDVEVRMVKSNRRRARERRVIVRNEGAQLRRQRPITSLLRSPDEDRGQPWGFV